MRAVCEVKTGLDKRVNGETNSIVLRQSQPLSRHWRQIPFQESHTLHSIENVPNTSFGEPVQFCVHLLRIADQGAFWACTSVQAQFSAASSRHHFLRTFSLILPPQNASFGELARSYVQLLRIKVFSGWGLGRRLFQKGGLPNVPYRLPASPRSACRVRAWSGVRTVSPASRSASTWPTRLTPTMG